MALFSRRSTCLCAMAILVVAVFGCGSSAADRSQNSGPERPVRWGVEKAGKRAVRLLASVPSCVYSKPQPLIHRIEVIYREHSTVITMLVRFPPRTDQPKICAGAEIFLRKWVKLKRPVSGQRLYDGSTSPPTKRWPLNRGQD
jgi:hypothetical protein